MERSGINPTPAMFHNAWLARRCAITCLPWSLFYVHAGRRMHLLAHRGSRRRREVASGVFFFIQQPAYFSSAILMDLEYSRVARWLLKIPQETTKLDPNPEP